MAPFSFAVYVWYFLLSSFLLEFVDDGAAVLSPLSFFSSVLIVVSGCSFLPCPTMKRVSNPIVRLPTVVLTYRSR